MHLNYANINTILQLPTLNKEGNIQHFLVDSRLLVNPSKTLFFALNGQKNNGHAFIEELYSKGVRAFVLSETPPSLPEATFFLVENVWKALHDLATFIRKQHTIPVIGITGSNGKTIIKEWLRQLLSCHANVLANPRSYNSQIGVPLSVSLLNDRHELAIFEAGISKPKEMQKLAHIIQPTIGIFTNLGAAHQEGFLSKDHKLAEKLQLFEQVETLVFCIDHADIYQAVQEKLAVHSFCWTQESNELADVHFTVSTQQVNESIIAVKTDQQYFQFQIPFTDENALENAMHCCCMLLLQNWPAAQIQQEMANLHPVGLRLELKDGRNQCTIIDDTYSNDLTSLASALNTLQKQANTNQQTRIIFLSDLLETGIKPEQLYQQVAFLLSSKVDQFIGIGAAITAIKAYLPPHIQAFFFEKTDACLSQFPFRALRQSIILIKGARSYQMEKISARLALRSHRTILEINRNALIHNLQTFKNLLHPGTKMAAVVKATAYGSGSIPIAKLLAAQQVDYLVVAYPDEGRELRLAGIECPLLVLNTDISQLDDMLHWQMEPEIYSWAQLERLAQINQPFKIHLKIDTGMHRLGFSPQASEALGNWLAKHPLIHVASVMTHLSASENRQHDNFSHQQVVQYLSAYQLITKHLSYQPTRHVLNTSGIIHFPAYHFDMVRLGIGLYGYESSYALKDTLQAALELKATITQIHDVNSGETVGYGRGGKNNSPRRIATLNIGYADGFPRSAGHGKFSVLIHQQKAPTVGAICMDMSMVDISDLQNIQEGDEALIFGKSLPIENLAEVAQTIPYEILTNISPRVHRVQVQE